MTTQATHTQSLKIVATVAIVILGLVHLWLARAAYGNAAYEGLLFELNGIGSLVAAALVYRDRDNRGWILGAIVAGTTLVGYVLTRTTGLPGLPAEPDEWFEPLGVVAVLCEVVFLVVFAMTRRSLRSPRIDRGAPGARVVGSMR